MGTKSGSGIGKDPSEVDEELPSEDQVMEHLEQQQAEAKSEAEETAPTNHELWMVIQDQQDQIARMQATIEGQNERIDELERQVEDVEFEASTMQEVADQFKKGEIGGEAGAEFLQEFVSQPPSDSLINAKSNQLFTRIIEERRVGKPVRSKDVVNWLGFRESSNPSVEAKRVMERMKQHREDGHYIGSVELGKYRGQNCIWLHRD